MKKESCVHSEMEQPAVAEMKHQVRKKTVGWQVTSRNPIGTSLQFFAIIQEEILRCFI